MDVPTSSSWLRHPQRQGHSRILAPASELTWPHWWLKGSSSHTCASRLGAPFLCPGGFVRPFEWQDAGRSVLACRLGAWVWWVLLVLHTGQELTCASRTTRSTRAEWPVRREPGAELRGHGQPKSAERPN